ncbi:MAG: tyrosine-type recombinase/integrase, partial [Steroidobacteraceae bacterium]
IVHVGRGTFEDAVTRWLRSKVRIRPSTRRSYEQLAACYLVPYFGNRKLRSIQVTDIERFRTELSERLPEPIRHAFIERQLRAKTALAAARAKQRAERLNASTRTINKVLTVLTMIFNYAMRNQWVARNPADYVEHARDKRPIEERPLDFDVLTPKEIAALRDAASPPSYRDGRLVTNNYRLLISFAIFTGCRVGEILGAAWSQIDWKSGQFHVRRAYREGKFQEPKTRTSYRRLTLPTFLLKELKVWQLACPNSLYDLVFPNLDGQPMSHTNLLQRGFYPALKRAGLRRIRFHDLRHTYASLMISNGEDIVRVSRLMGHANASITLNVYSHLMPREHDPSGDRLASLVFGNKVEADTKTAVGADSTATEKTLQSAS